MNHQLNQVTIFSSYKYNIIEEKHLISFRTTCYISIQHCKSNKILHKYVRDSTVRESPKNIILKKKKKEPKWLKINLLISMTTKSQTAGIRGQAL